MLNKCFVRNLAGNIVEDELLKKFGNSKEFIKSAHKNEETNVRNKVFIGDLVLC